MTTKAEGANVGEVALAAAFDDGDDVVGVPERFARAGAETPVREERRSRSAAREAKCAGGGDGVGTAVGADAAVAFEYLLAQVGGLGAQLPLVNAELGAEGEAAFGNFERAPAAEAPAIWAARDGFAVDPATLHCAHRAHRSFLNWRLIRTREEACGGCKVRYVSGK